MMTNQWGTFTIGEVFELSNSKAYHKSDVVEWDGEKRPLAYVTRTSVDNGLELHINWDVDFEVNDRNLIAFGAENAEFFYHEYPFITGNKMYILNHSRLNKFNGLSLVALLNNSIKGAGFGYALGMTAARLGTKGIVLPVDSDGDLDWDYLEEIGRRMITENSSCVEEYVRMNYNELMEDVAGFEEVSLDEVEWKDFHVEDFFESKRGNQKNMASLRDGNYPLVSARKFENGYKAFVGPNEYSLFAGNVLTLNNDGDGGAGLAYYQPYNFYLDTHVTALKPKDKLDKYSQLFVSCTISLQSDKFGNNYPINKARLSALKVMLPVDNEGRPDWDFMSLYMKQIELKKLGELIKFLDSKVV